MSSIRILSLALAATVTAAPAAFAQEASADSASGKHFSVVGGYAITHPTRNPSIAGTRARLDGEGAPTLAASYHINDHVAIEAWGADRTGHRVRSGGQKVASVDAQPYALSAQYHFGEADSSLRPFVGLGYHETNFNHETASAGTALAGQRIGIDTAKGAVGTVGIDVNLGPSWFARADARYFQGNGKIKLDGARAGDARIDPVTVGVGIGARF